MLDINKIRVAILNVLVEILIVTIVLSIVIKLFIDQVDFSIFKIAFGAMAIYFGRRIMIQLCLFIFGNALIVFHKKSFRSEDMPKPFLNVTKAFITLWVIVYLSLIDWFNIELMHNHIDLKAHYKVQTFVFFAFASITTYTMGYFTYYLKNNWLKIISKFRETLQHYVK